MNTDSKSLLASRSTDNNFTYKLFKNTKAGICILAIAVICLEIIAFFADLCPANYWWGGLEKIVTYDIN